MTKLRDPHDPGQVYFKIAPTDTNYVNRILEGYEYLGVMTTLNGPEGICMVRSTEGTRELVKEILQSLAVSVEFLATYETID